MKPRWVVLAFVDLVEQGAPRTHVLEFSRALTKYADVAVLNPAPEADVTADGFEYVQCCPPIPQPARLRLLSSAVATASCLRRLHRVRPLDAIYIRDNVTAVAALLWARCLSIPTVLEVNGPIREEMLLYAPALSGPRLLLWRLRLSALTSTLRLCYRLASKIVVVSTGLGRNLVSAYGVPPSKVGAFGNGANVDLFAPMDRNECRRRLDLDLGARYIGFVGNLAPWQGLDDLLNAFALLAAEHDDLRLLVVGDGTETPHLRELARSLSVESRVRFTGRVPYADVALYANASDVCAAPFGNVARNRMSGLSALKTREYLACGKPVVASDLEDTKLVEEGRVGRLYPAGDVRRLARSLDEILGLPPEELAEMGRRARKLAVERLSWDATASGIFGFVSTCAPGEC